MNLSDYIAWSAIAATAALLALVAFTSGCGTITPEVVTGIVNDISKSEDDPEKDFGMIDEPFVNPVTGENLPGSISEYFTVKPKTYDQTYRIAVPSTYLDEKLIDESSYVLINGEHKATWRGRDWDHGANRAKYTLPLAVRLPSPSTFELFTGDGAKVMHIESGIPNGGKYLPNGKADGYYE